MEAQSQETLMRSRNEKIMLKGDVGSQEVWREMVRNDDT